MFGPNKNYTGKLKPFIEKLIIIIASDMSTEFNAYQNNEIDMAANFTPADIALICCRCSAQQGVPPRLR